MGTQHVQVCKIYIPLYGHTIFFTGPYSPADPTSTIYKFMYMLDSMGDRKPCL